MAHVWYHWGQDDWEDFGDPGEVSSQVYDIDVADDYVYQTPSQQYEASSFLEYDPYDTGEGEFGGVSRDEYGTYKKDEPLVSYEQSAEISQQGLDDIPPKEEQSYADWARSLIAKTMPFVKDAQQILTFAKKMTSKYDRQPQRGGGGRQIKAPYTTHRAGTEGRTQADIRSTFQGRNSKQLMAQLNQQSERSASAVQIVANRAAQVGKPISGNDLYDLIAKEGQPRGVKQKLPGTGWGLTLTSRQRA